MIRIFFQPVREAVQAVARKLVRTGIAAVVAVLLAAPLAADAQPTHTATGTSAEMKVKIVGKWRKANEKEWFLFTDGGQVQWMMYSNFGKLINYGGSWSIDNNRLSVRFAADASFVTRVEFRSATEMTLTEGNEIRRYIREEPENRPEPTPLPPPMPALKNAPAKADGNWVACFNNGVTEKYAFGENGTIRLTKIYDGQNYTYTGTYLQQSDTIRLDFGNGQRFEYRVTFTGQFRMTLIGSDGYSFYMDRE